MVDSTHSADDVPANLVLTFIRRLSILRDTATTWANGAFRPMPEKRVGFIEAVAVDEAGVIWVVGWMEKDGLVDRPLVILDGAKHAGGFAYMTLNRSDLSDRQTGFIGAIQTDWRPNKSSTPYIFIDRDTGIFLESISPVNVITKDNFVNHCRDIWPLAQIGYTQELRALLYNVQSWSRPPDMFVAERAAIESVIMLPDFGFFVSGWAVSPTKAVAGFMLKAGNHILASNPLATSFRSRPDLANIYPVADRLYNNAGYFAVFEGKVPRVPETECVLKIIYEDGTAINHPIPLDRVHRLGHSINLERALDLFPSLTAEAFFPSFANAARGVERVRSTSVDPFHVEPCTSAVVVTLPKSRSDAYLAADNVYDALKALPRNCSVILLSCQDESRDLSIRLFSELRSFGRPVSLFFVQDRDLGAYALEIIGQQTGMEQFLYVGPRAHLSAPGWQAAARLDGRLRFLSLMDPVHDDLDVGQPSFECFGWSTSEFANWLKSQPLRIGGLSAMPPSRDLLSGSQVVSNAAYRVHTRSASPLVDAINHAPELI